MDFLKVKRKMERCASVSDRFNVFYHDEFEKVFNRFVSKEKDFCECSFSINDENYLYLCDFNDYQTQNQKMLFLISKYDEKRENLLKSFRVDFIKRVDGCYLQICEWRLEDCDYKTETYLINLKKNELVI